MTRLLRSTLVIALILLAAQHLAVQGQVPASGRTVRVNDIEMYYEERGAGEPLVLCTASAVVVGPGNRLPPPSRSTSG